MNAEFFSAIEISSGKKAFPGNICMRRSTSAMLRPSGRIIPRRRKRLCGDGRGKEKDQHVRPDERGEEVADPATEIQWRAPGASAAGPRRAPC